MVRILHYIPEEYAPGSTPRQIILTLILPERAAKVRYFSRNTKPFSKEKEFFAQIFRVYINNYIRIRNIIALKKNILLCSKLLLICR